PAVRAAGRGAGAGAEPRLHAALPGGPGPPAAGDGAGPAGPRRGIARNDERNREVRPDSPAGRGAGGPLGSALLQPGPPRPWHDRAPLGPLPDPPRRGGRGARTADLGAPPPAVGGTAGACGAVDRGGARTRAGAGARALRGPGPAPAGGPGRRLRRAPLHL